MENIKFKSEGLELAGVIVLPEFLKDKNPAILFIHGLTGQKENSYQYAEALAKIGYASLLFDMRGHGQSEGDLDAANLDEFLEDAVAACDQLCKIKEIDSDSISVIGSSMGAYLAARLTSKRNIKNLVMRAPADYPNSVVDKPTMDNGGDNPVIASWRKQVKNNLDSFGLEAVHDFNGQILFIESEKDDMVPPQTVQNYLRATADPSKVQHILLKGAPHSIKEGKFRDEVERTLVNWFQSM